jgi:eukaryotic-like serine/threonine-protein kinase
VTTALQPGDPRRLGRYELLARVGAGGMGTVYLGRDPGGRRVAIKVIRPEYAGEDEFRARFRSEVTRARQVPPFCTAEVLDADPDHETPYLVQEYVDGPDLADVVDRDGPLTGGALHGVAVGVATALATIHGAGVVHRDLKPRNVLFALGSPKVIDFGIARALEVTSRHTRTDQMVGTLTYMAPERFDPAQDHLVGPAADVFAWGAVVAYAGTGRTPFGGDTPAVTAARILTQPPNLEGLPEPLKGLVARALAKEPVERPTAQQLLDLLLTSSAPETAPVELTPGGFSPGGSSPGSLSNGSSSTGGLSRGGSLPGGLSRGGSLPEGAGRDGTGTGGIAARPSGFRWQWAVAAVAVLALLGGTALFVSHLAARGTLNEAAGEAGSESPAGPESPAVPTVYGPAVIDRLDRAGQWHELDYGEQGKCVFGKQLVATAEPGFAMECWGPTTVFNGDQSIAVDVTPANSGSCALVWFRDLDPNGSYRLSLCPGRSELGVVREDKFTRTAATDTPGLTPGTRNRVTVTLQAEQLTATAGDTTVFRTRLSEPALAAGAVTFGATTKDSTTAAKVSFANADVRSAGGSTGFPDLTAASADAVAIAASMDEDERAVVLESAVPDLDQKVAKGSRTLVTVPLAEGAKYFGPELSGSRDCYPPETLVATCPIPEERFRERINGTDGSGAVKVSIRGGEVVSLAQMDLS